MPFEKGHKYYAPKEGVMPGRRKDQSRAIRNYSITGRQMIDVETMIAWDMAIMAGHNPKLETDDEGNHSITWEERGELAPTLDQKMKAKQNLEQRLWGAYAQQIHIDGEIRAYTNSLTAVIPVTRLSPGDVIHLRDVIQGLGKPQELPAINESSDDNNEE